LKAPHISDCMQHSDAHAAQSMDLLTYLLSRAFREVVRLHCSLTASADIDALLCRIYLAYVLQIFKML